jgi:small Trp-rich protein
MSDKQTVTGGISTLGLLGVVFITLKLAEIGVVAKWSWWWVTAPFWGLFALAIVLLIAFFTFIFFVELYKGYKIKKQIKRIQKENDLLKAAIDAADKIKSL